MNRWTRKYMQLKLQENDTEAPQTGLASWRR